MTGIDFCFIGEASGKHTATMKYSNFENNIIRRFKVDIVNYPFPEMKSCSNMKHAEVDKLLSLLTCEPPVVHFVKLTKQEVAERLTGDGPPIELPTDDTSGSDDENSPSASLPPPPKQQRISMTKPKPKTTSTATPAVRQALAPSHHQPSPLNDTAYMTHLTFAPESLTTETLPTFTQEQWETMLNPGMLDVENFSIGDYFGDHSDLF
jgi:hypothetical protein